MDLQASISVETICSAMQTDGIPVIVTCHDDYTGMVSLPRHRYSVYIVRLEGEEQEIN